MLPRLLALENMVERALARLVAIERSVAGLAQQAWQQAGASGGESSSGAGPLVRIYLPTGIAAGTNLTTPGTATDAKRLVRSGSGYTTSGADTITVLNFDLTAITGTNKMGWAVHREDDSWELAIGDC